MVFIKGKSGNPGGRPKKDWSWSGLLSQVAEEVEEKSGKTFKELVVRRLYMEAVNGNMGAIKEITSRMDGLPQRIDGDLLATRQELTIVNIDKIIGLSKE